MSSNAVPTLSADEALLRLKAGNERFLTGTGRILAIRENFEGWEKGADWNDLDFMH